MIPRDCEPIGHIPPFVGRNTQLNDRSVFAFLPANQVAVGKNARRSNSKVTAFDIFCTSS